VARWRAAAARIEAPEWYRNYHPEDWDEPDAHELRMRAGCPSMDPWPDYLREVHAERRWHEAKHAYRQAHPAFASQELEDLFEEFRRDWPPSS
jgi:hypothetical protein